MAARHPARRQEPRSAPHDDRRRAPRALAAAHPRGAVASRHPRLRRLPRTHERRGRSALPGRHRGARPFGREPVTSVAARNAPPMTSAPPTPIAIDGPAASGKSTLGRVIAERFGFLFLDTGLMYRAVTLAALEASVPPEDEAASALLQRIDLHVTAD